MRITAAHLPSGLTQPVEAGRPSTARAAQGKRDAMSGQESWPTGRDAGLPCRSDGGVQHAAANARDPAIRASRRLVRHRPGPAQDQAGQALRWPRPALPDLAGRGRQEMAARGGRSCPDRGVGPRVCAGRAGGAGRIPAGPGPGGVRVLAGVGRGAGARRLPGRPAAAGRCRGDPADVPGGRYPAGAGGRGRAGPEPGVVRGVRPAASGRCGGRLRLLPAFRRRLGSRVPATRRRRGHGGHGSGGHRRAHAAHPAGPVGLSPRCRAAPCPARRRPARCLHPARTRRVGSGRRRHGHVRDRGNRRARARRAGGCDPARDRAGARQRPWAHRAAAAGRRAGRRGGPPALPGWPAPHRSDPDRGAVAVRTPGRHTARCRDVRPAASTISAARRRAAGGRRHRRPDSARPPGAATPQRSRLQPPPPARQLPPAAPKRTHPARLPPRQPRSLQCPAADHRYPLRPRPRRTSPSRRRPTTRPVRAPAMQQ